MARIDLTQNVHKNVVEITNNTTQVTVELNAGLLLSQNVTDVECCLPTDAVAGQYLQWDGSNWIAVDLTNTGGGGGGTGGALASDINTTDAVGNISAGTNIPAGTTFEQIFNDMLVSYQAPVMSLSGWTTGSFEHGATFSDSTYNLSFTNDSNIDTNVNGTYSLSDTYLGQTGGVATPADGSYTTSAYSGQLLVTNSNAGVGATSRGGAAKLTVSGFQNTEGGSINSATKQSTVLYRYWVVESATALSSPLGTASSTIMLGGADLNLDGTGSGVIESGLMSSVSNLGFTAAGGYDYVYWIFPAAFTVSNMTQNTSINLYAGDTADQTTAVIYLGEVDMLNQYGETVRMQMLRSKVSNAFASGSVIAVS